MAFLQDLVIELELPLALVLAALEPAAEDLQEVGASYDGGEGGEDSIGEVAHARGAGDFQAEAGAEGNHKGCPYGRWRGV